MDGQGGDFLQGDEDEAAPGHSGMGKGEAWGAENGPSGQEDIDVDEPRPVPDAGLPSHPGLDRLDEPEHFARGQGGFHADGGVQEPWLNDGADRFGPVDGGYRPDPDAFRSEAFDGLFDPPPAVAEVAPQAEIIATPFR